MKKLMIAMGAAALCGAVFADVTSANIVGYTTKQSKDQTISYGSMFVNISNGAKWTLGQLLPKGMDEGYDFIQFLSTDTASTYLTATWYNYEDYGEFGGWCNTEDEDELLDGLELTPGTAFLSNFTSGNSVDYVFSGAVGEAGSDGKVTVDVAGQHTPFIANPIPREIKLGDITPVGIEEGYDFIQFLSTDTATTYLTATWYNYEEYGEFGGWCNTEDEDELLDDMPINPGQAFLGMINTDNSKNVKFIFPAAIEK